MKRKNFKHWGLFIALQLITLSLFAQGPNNTGTYYQSANGKKGKALKTAMFNIISKHNQLSYDGLWTAFKTTDMREDGKVWDMYSDKTNENKIANWNAKEFAPIASHDSYKPYKDWQMKMLMEWSKKDPVSQKEINRN